MLTFAIALCNYLNSTLKCNFHDFISCLDIFPYTHPQKQAFHQTPKPRQTLFATARATLSAWFRCPSELNKTTGREHCSPPVLIFRFQPESLP